MATPTSEPPPSPFREIRANLIDNPGLWTEEALAELTLATKTFLPNLLGALALLVIGWAAAFVLRWLIHPSVLISAFILFVGYLISNGVRNMVVVVAETSGFRHGLSMGQLASGFVLAFTLLLGLDQLGLDADVFASILVLASAALVIEEE